MVILNKKLKASSLIEVVIAAIIILASFTIAMSVLSKTASENDVLHRIELNSIANELIDGQKIGELEKRGMKIQSSINNRGDIVSEQKVVGKTLGSEVQKRTFMRRRLIQTKK